MSFRNASILLLLALALAALPAAAQDAAGKALLFADPADLADLAAEARALGAAVRALPGALELDADVAARLEDRALRLELLPDPHLVRLAAGEIDLREHPLDLAESGAATPFIVASDGVPDTAFMGSLAAAGATVVGPLPPSSFLVRGDAAAARRIAGLPGVAALGGFDPTFKLSHRLAPGPLAARTEIVLFAGEDGGEALAELEALGIEAEIVTTSGQVVLAADLPVAARGRLAALPSVEALDAATRPAFYNNEIRVLMQTTKAHYQANQAFYNPVYAIGVWGASQLITAADGGLDNHEVFFGPGKLVSNTAAGPCVTVLDDFGNHGTGVAATLLGDRIAVGGAYGTANDLDGVAIRSRLAMQDIADHLGSDPCPPGDTASGLFIPAWLTGSLIHTNSWGHYATPGVPFDGTYSWRSRRIDEYLHFPLFREHSVLFAAGNAGAHWTTGAYLAFTLSDEAHAKNAIAVGGSWNGNLRDTMYKFSSHGPANDCLGVPCAGLRRVKPDVVAPADKVVDTADNATPNAYSTFSGTSIATPAVAGAAALVRDYFAQGKYPNDPRDPPLGGPPSSALVKAMLVNATVPLYDRSAYHGNAAQGLPANAYPNYDQGYGRPTLDNVLEPAGYRTLKVFEDATTTSQTGDVWTRNVQLTQKWGGTCNNLRVTLVWNDEIGTLAAGPKLVNDLDLEVTYQGVTTRGNHRLTGGAWDGVNNVEDVFVPKGFVQPFTVFPVTIRVYGRAVPAGPQPWAVVLTYGSCADQTPCPPPPVAAGCYRGPGDVVPGSAWLPPVPGCRDQTYSLGEYAGLYLPYPRCEPPHIVVPPVQPQPLEPGEPIGHP